MDIFEYIKNLCTPAYVYLVISSISIFALMFEKGPEYVDYCMDSFGCKVGSISFMVLSQFAITAIWVVVLDKVCKKGYPLISWFLVSLPYLTFFIALWLLIRNGKVKKKRKKKSL